MLFSEVVAASAAVGATRSRTAKAAAIADLLRAAAPAEVEPVTAWLAGEARQGRHRRRLAHAVAASTRRPAAEPVARPSSAVDADARRARRHRGRRLRRSGGRELLARPVRRRHRRRAAVPRPRCSPASCARARWRA